jgi:GMP reductase
VKNMITYLQGKNSGSTFIIAGNVATPEAVIDLENWGADATKVGIGPGKVCITKLKTGFGTGGWQLSALKWCARVATKPIIADGGIREHGDIAKSIRFGATMVMIGSCWRARGKPGPNSGSGWQVVQGVLRLRQRLQQG